MLAESVLQRVIDQLQDTNPPIQWSKDELIRYLNEGRRVIVENRPGVGSIHDVVRLSPGSLQNLPAGGSRFLKVDATLVHTEQDVLPLKAAPFRSDTVEDVQVISLDENRAMLLWRDLRNGGAGAACLAIREGSYVRFTPHTIYNDTYTTCSAVALSSSQVVVFYADQDASNAGTLRLLETGLNDTIIVGPAEVIDATGIAYPSISALAPGVLVLAYEDLGNSSYGTAVAIRTSGQYFQYGSPVVFNSAVSTYVACASISATRAVVCFNDAVNSNKGRAVVLSLSGLTLTVGTPITFATGPATNIRAVRLSFGNVIACFTDTGAGSAGKAVAMSVAGAVITAGSSATFNSGSTSDIGLCRLNQGKAAVVYKDAGASNVGNSVILTVTGTTVAAGAEKTFESDAVAFCAVGTMGSTRLLACYEDTTNSSFGQGVLMPWTGTAATPIVPATFSTGTAIGLVATVLDENHVAFVYGDAGNSNRLTCCIVQIVADVITVGTPVQLAAADVSGSTHNIAVTALTPALLAIGYRDATDSNKGKVMAVSVAGTVPTAGTPVAFLATEAVWISVSRLNSNTGILVARDNASTFDLITQAFTIAGTTTTLGTQVIADSGDNQQMRVSGLSSTLALAIFVDNNNMQALSAIPLSVSGTTITPGTKAVVSTGAASYPSLSRMTATVLVATWQDGALQQRLQAAVLCVTPSSIVNGTTLAATVAVGVSVPVTDSPALYTRAAVVDSTHLIVDYQDSGNGSAVTAKVIKRKNATLTVGIANVLSTTATTDAPVAFLASGRAVLGHQNSNGTATLFWLPGNVYGKDWRIVDLDSFDRHQPGWRNDPPGDPDTFIFDPQNPKEFWSYPPVAVDGTVTVMEQYSRYPDDIPQSTDVVPYLATDTDLDFNEDYAQMLVEWVLWRAYDKEDEVSVMGKAQEHFQVFIQAFQAGGDADTGSTPQVRQFAFSGPQPKPQSTSP